MAMYLGLSADEKPISTLRRLCVEQMHSHRNTVWPRWDGLDGFGKKALNWEAYLSTVQYEDSPAGLFELEAL
eukprot:408662-Prorocentrum_lima.AAC.1